MNYCPPYTPTAKAKIERWFLTLKTHWLSTLNMGEFTTIEELRKSLNAFVIDYNNREHSSLDGQTPFDRFFSESHLIKYLDPEKIDNIFLQEEKRKVSADGVISLNSVYYEVPFKFSKKKVPIRYSPDMSEVYVEDREDYKSTLIPITTLNKRANANAKRKKINLSSLIESDGGDD